MRFEGKQVVQIPFQAQIRASQLLMRVVRFARFFVDRPLVEKALIRFKPRLQGALKAFLVLCFSFSARRHSALPAAVFGLRVR